MKTSNILNFEKKKFILCFLQFLMIFVNTNEVEERTHVFFIAGLKIH